MARSKAPQPQETMTQSRALQPQEKKELVSKEETTVPVRYFVPTTDIDLPPEKWTPGYADFRSACSGVI